MSELGERVTRGLLSPPPPGPGSPCGRHEEQAAGAPQAFPSHPCYFLFFSPKRKKRKKNWTELQGRPGLSLISVRAGVRRGTDVSVRS